jgi:hypothetical protein
MRKTGSQLVHEAAKAVQDLCTKCMQILNNNTLSPFAANLSQSSAHVMRHIVHTFREQITEVVANLSPLSTALIYEHNMEIKN